MAGVFQIKTYGSTLEALAEHGEFLEHTEAENGVLLGTLALETAMVPRVLAAAIDERGELALMGHARFSLLHLSHGRGDAVETIARCAFELVPDLPGVNGPIALTQAFASHWGGFTGTEPVKTRDQRLLKLDRAPTFDFSSVPGQLDDAGPEDVELLTVWMLAFFQQAAAEEVFTLDQARARVQWGIDTRSLFVWRQGEAAVSMVSVVRPTRHGISLNLGYTPPELRQRGLAAAVIAGGSKHALDSGRQFCFCLANEMSDPICIKLGYRPLLDFQSFHFPRSAVGAL